jgi:hypothetical protein
MVTDLSALSAVLVAIRSVETVQGAVRLYQAERDGRCRPVALRAAERPIEELRGTETARVSPLLAVEGRPVDAEETAWERLSKASGRR